MLTGAVQVTDDAIPARYCFFGSKSQTMGGHPLYTSYHRSLLFHWFTFAADDRMIFSEKICAA